MRLAADRAYRAVVLTTLGRGAALSGITLVNGVADGDATQLTRRHGQRLCWHRGDDEHLAASCQPHHSKADDGTHRATAVAILRYIGKQSTGRCTQAPRAIVDATGPGAKRSSLVARQ
jgi:hypothetical protein